MNLSWIIAFISVTATAAAITVYACCFFTLNFDSIFSLPAFGVGLLLVLVTLLSFVRCSVASAH